MDSITRDFKTVLRGPSALVFGEGEAFKVHLNVDEGEVIVVYSTRWVHSKETGGGAAGEAEQAQLRRTMPGHLIAQVSGPYTGNAQQTMEAHAAAALTLLPLFAVVSNAAIGDMQIEVGFESTAGLSEREFFQCQVKSESGEPRPAQIAPTPLIVEAMRCFATSPYKDRLMRACNQHLLALQNWGLGHESLAVEHLWMAVEALTKAVLRNELQVRGLKSDDELALSLGVEKKKLDAALRRDIILRGDAETYRDALAASDGLEHGFLEYGPMRKKAAGIRDRLAVLVRQAILSLAQLDAKQLATLTADPYSKQIGLHPMAKYVRGKLVGTPEHLAAPGNEYPFLDWRTEIQPDGPAESGGVQKYTFNEHFTPRIADGVAFAGSSVELWH